MWVGSEILLYRVQIPPRIRALNAMKLDYLSLSAPEWPESSATIDHHHRPSSLFVPPLGIFVISRSGKSGFRH